MVGFSGRTRRKPFAIIMTVCFFSSAIMLSATPLIDNLATMDPIPGIIVANLMTIAAVVWTISNAFAWVVFSVRRLRDAGWPTALVVVSVVLGLANNSVALLNPGSWAENLLALALTLLCLGWLVILTVLPSRTERLSGLVLASS